MTLLVGSIFHMTRKIVSEMTYNVSMGTLNPTIPIPFLLLLSEKDVVRLCIKEGESSGKWLTQFCMEGWQLDQRVCVLSTCK